MIFPTSRSRSQNLGGCQPLKITESFSVGGGSSWSWQCLKMLSFEFSNPSFTLKDIPLHALVGVRGNSIIFRYIHLIIGLPSMKNVMSYEGGWWCCQMVMVLMTLSNFNANELLCSSWNDSFDASAIGCSDLSLSWERNRTEFHGRWFPVNRRDADVARIWKSSSVERQIKLFHKSWIEWGKKSWWDKIITFKTLKTYKRWHLFVRLLFFLCPRIG